MSVSNTVIQIPSELFAVAESSRFEGEVLIESLTIGPDEYRFDQPVQWVVDVTNTGSAFLIAGAAKGNATVACSRCLEDVPYDFDADIEGYFLIDAAEDASFDDEDDIGEDEFEVLPADHVVDLLPLIKAALMVDAPNQPLCREDCAGLCPQCGARLNDGPCGCGEDEALADFEAASNPFSALAGLSFED